MNIISLPEKLLGTNDIPLKDVMFYHHIGHDSNYRSKISFNTHCITLLLTGKKQVVAGDQHIDYGNKSCLFFKTGNYLSTEISADGKPYHSLLIFFSEKVLNECRHKYSHLLSEPAADCPEHPYLFIPSDEYIENFKASTLQSLESGTFSSSLQVLKFEEIMLYLLEQQGRKVIDFFEQSRSNDEVSTFKKVVEANILKKICVEELAFLCAMSRSTFKRRFVEVYGKSPGQWQMEKRLDHSAFLLSVKKLNPSEVYEEAGFSTLSSFTQSFKKKFGLTPKQYQLG